MKRITVKFSEDVGVEIDDDNDIRLDLNELRHVYLDPEQARRLAKSLKKAARRSERCDGCPR